MKNQKISSSGQKSSPPYAALLIGVGLLILGIVAALLIASPDNIDNSPDVFSTENEVSSIPVQVNFVAPEITLSDLSGEKASLADFGGQVVLVNNWATWCPPCKAEMPTLQAYYEEHKDEGFLLIGIEAGEPADEVAQFIDEYKLTFPIWLDPNNQALSAFQNDNLPSSYVIDREGVVRLAWVGAVSKAILEKYVTPLLEE